MRNANKDQTDLEATDRQEWAKGWAGRIHWTIDRSCPPLNLFSTVE